jgi:hypothetical protein
MSKEREIKGYCLYCKSAIYYGDAYTVDKNNKIYHPSCYEQLNTYSDEFGTYNTDQFGDSIDE